MQTKMNNFDADVMKRFDTKNTTVALSHDVPDWNRLSLDEDDPTFASMF